MHLLKKALLPSILVFLVQPAMAQTPYSRSFPLKVGDLDVGELVVSFEDALYIGDFSVRLSTDGSPSQSVVPPYATPAVYPQLGAPLFVAIETTSAFRGPALVSLRVVLLEYNPRVPLRLFAADGTQGSVFRDITASVGRGSMYTTGYRAGFSEFVIALDQRPNQWVIGTKISELDAALEANESFIEPARYRSLRSLLDQIVQNLLRLVVNVLRPIVNLLNLRILSQTLEDLNEFMLLVREGAARGEIPDTYNDPANPAGNVAGDLFARAQTAAFSVALSR